MDPLRMSTLPPCGSVPRETAKLRVAIVGAGISGLAALKECLASGFDATAFESRPDIGGQWYYDAKGPDPIPSNDEAESLRPPLWEGACTTNMYDGVILNSCRDTTHFSDFPMSPDRYSEFFGHRLFKKYINDYAEHFSLYDAIRVGTTVLSCRLNASDECHVYRRPGTFEGQKVAVIGFGNSAADISCELAPLAKEVHMITRRGGWVVPRYAFGRPAEAFNSRMAESVMPKMLSERIQTAILNIVMGELPDAIKPEHTVHQANVTVRGDLVENIKTSRIKVHRAEVDEITETGLNLSNRKAVEVDAIICCTGYKINFPYLAPADLDPRERAPPLYKHIVPPRAHNLFILGIIELPGPALPVIEAQARWSVAILEKRVHLPSVREMEDWVSEYQDNISKTMVRSDRHAAGVIRYTPYCDDLLSRLNAAPTLSLLLRELPKHTHNPVTILRLLRAVYLGISSPAQYRLFGHGAKTDLAIATLLRLSMGGKELSAKEKQALALGLDSDSV